MNYIDIVSEFDVINEYTFSPLVKSIPRKTELVIVTHKKPEITWSLEDSASFRDTRQNDEVKKIWNLSIKLNNFRN